MNNPEFRLVPSENAVYKVMEDCCYTKVVFEGPGLGIYPRFDKENELVGILLCYCHPKLEIKPVPEDFYQAYYNLVTEQLHKA